MTTISDYIKYQGRYLCYQLTPTNKIKLILTNNKLKPIIKQLNEEYPKYKGAFIIVNIIIDKTNTKSIISANIKLYINDNGSYIDFDDIEDDNLFLKYEPQSKYINTIINFSIDFLIKYGWSYKYINDILKKLLSGFEIINIRFPFYDKHILDKTPKVQKMIYEPIIKERKEYNKTKINPLSIIKKNIKDEGLLHAYVVINNKLKLLFIDNSIRKIIKSIEEYFKDKETEYLIIITNILFHSKDSGFPSSVSFENNFYLFKKNKLLKIEKFKNRIDREYFNKFKDDYQKLTIPIFIMDDYLIKNGWDNNYIKKGFNKLLSEPFVINKKRGWYVYDKI
jgi:hypothetical protein